MSIPVSVARSDMRERQKKAIQQLEQCSQKIFDVIIVGSGITGSQAAYNLLCLGSKGPSSVLLLDSGEIGAGSHERFVAPENVPLPSSAPYKQASGPGDERVYHARNSGGVIFSPPHFCNGPTKTKFMVQLYPATTIDFLEHHGAQGARSYLKLAAIGLELQKLLAHKLFGPRVGEVMDEAGSVLVADAAHAADLEVEFRLLTSLGVEGLTLLDALQLSEMHGECAGWVRGIHFPREARIDALAFVNAVIEACCAMNSDSQRLTVVEYSPAMISVEDRTVAGEPRVAVTLTGSYVLQGNHCVVATNGMFLGSHLNGILRPCWSYFLTLPHPRDITKSQQSNKAVPPSLLGGISSPNFFSYGFTHDWCVTDGAYRISGADHFSALKPPRAMRRCQELADWTFARYPYMREFLSLSRSEHESSAWLRGRYVYGIYGETPDLMPLVGKPYASSRIVYAVGCNAWGQSSMSFAAALIPGILGFSVLSPEWAELADAMAISRFKHNSPPPPPQILSKL